MTRRSIRSVRRKLIMALISSGAVTFMSPGYSRAQLSIVEAGKDVKQAFDTVKGLYDAYKTGKGILAPDPTTADLINAAVLQLSNLVVDSFSANAVAAAQTAIQEYTTALHSMPANASLAQFDRDAQSALNTIENLLILPKNPNYAHILGPTYNSLLPLYLANHLAGTTWGSPVSQSQLESEFISRARFALQRNYDMIGGKIITGGATSLTTTTSQLGNWVMASSSGSPIATTADLAAAYFQTDASVQAIQKASAALFAIIQESGANPSLLTDSSKGNATVTVDLTGWTDNWRGRSDAFWTSMQPYVYGPTTGSPPCPHDYGMITAWEMPVSLSSYLCVPLPGISPPAVTSTYVLTNVAGPCNNGFCNYSAQCGSSDIFSGHIFSGGACSHRVDTNGESIPRPGVSTSTSVHFSTFPTTGAFFDLPADTYLTGEDPTDYRHGNFVYWYAPIYPSLMAFTPALFGVTR